VQADWLGTVALAVTSSAAVATEAVVVRAVAAVVALGLFALGCVAYLAGYARAVERSRSEDIAMAALIFGATGTAPVRLRRSLLAATVAQLLIGIVAASLRPFSTVAFGVLAVTFGIGVQALWNARFGTFPARRTATPTREDFHR
jgi:hypothetical protein